MSRDINERSLKDPYKAKWSIFFMSEVAEFRFFERISYAPLPVGPSMEGDGGKPQSRAVTVLKQRRVESDSSRAETRVDSSRVESGSSLTRVDSSPSRLESSRVWLESDSTRLEPFPTRARLESTRVEFDSSLTRVDSSR